MAETYGLDMETAFEEHSARHIATLAAQLPRGSRCMRAIEPDCEWSDADWMLRDVEHMLASLIWAKGGGKGLRPSPRSTPSERARLCERAASTDLAAVRAALDPEGVYDDRWLTAQSTS